jgi:transmembrane sensor
MTLDVKSSAAVRLSTNPSGAQVHLLEGHALFEGVHNRNNSLQVSSGNMVMDVLGTAFDVYQDQSGTTVKVSDGQVRVTSNCNSTAGSSADQSQNQSGLAGPTAMLHNGQMVTAASGTCGEPLDIRAAEVASVHQQVISGPEWLDFKDTTVREAVEQFNRYNARRIVVSDPKLAKRHIGGRFHPSDMETFLEILMRDYSAHVVRGTSPDGSQVIYLVPAKAK